MRTEQIDHKYLGRDIDPEKIEITRQVDSFVYSTDGKKYVDFTMGWCVGNFGWNNAAIKKRMRTYDGPDYIGPHYLYRPWAELAHRLALIAPGKLKKSFRATGGSEAVEMALAAAMEYTGRSKFISLEGAYHGDTIAARSVGSPSFGQWYKNTFSAHKIKGELNVKSAQQVEEWLKKRDIAGLIMEPIVCNKGVAIPDTEFMLMVQDSCQRHGALLIMDEVATGFGRTGKIFASEHYHLEPDIMTVGKALSAGLAPIGATLMTEKVAEAVGEGENYSTYGWHPMSVQAALGTLDYLESHFNFLVLNIREIGNFIVDQISLMEFEEEPIICHKGLAIGVSFESKDYGERIVKKARDNGLILSSSDNGFCMFPALNISRTVVEEALDRLMLSI